MELGSLLFLSALVLLAHSLAKNLFGAVAIGCGVVVFTINIAVVAWEMAARQGLTGWCRVAVGALAVGWLIAVAVVGMLAQKHRARMNAWSYAFEQESQWKRFCRWIVRSRYLLCTVIAVVALVRSDSTGGMGPHLALLFWAIIAALVVQSPDGFGIRANVMIRNQGLPAARRLKVANGTLGLTIFVAAMGMTNIAEVDANLQLALFSWFGGAFCWWYRTIYLQAEQQSTDIRVVGAMRSAQVTAAEGSWGLFGVGLSLVPVWLGWPWAVSFPAVLIVTLGIANCREHGRDRANHREGPDDREH